MSSFFLNADGVFIKLVLAAMFAFLGSEFIAIFPIFINYEKTKENVLKHIVPIWEITGTMIVFFVVELELIYSSLTPIASYLFIPTVGLFVLLLVLRNASIIYAEFIWKKIDSKPLYMFYAVATFLMVVGFVTSVAILMTGLGIHLVLNPLDASYINFLTILGNGVYWVFLIGALFISFGMSQVFYRTVKNTSYVPLATIIIGLILDSYAYLEIAHIDKVSVAAYLAVPIILTLIIPVMYMMKSTTEYASYKPLWFTLMTFAMLSLELPVTKIAGGAFPVNAFASPNSMLAFNFYLSILGGIFYLLLMLLYAYLYSSGKIMPKVSTAKTKVEDKAVKEN
ncbi:hypothetical protein [Acidiplasma sp.]|uniref:hypothetical protein n=1 Tax=Acidiplasma sp. TaxID=1872114 RepID=UPI00258C0208|nr:hypothetical protein [Acidiplasma sp.]